jgi:hypothetical protein
VRTTALSVIRNQSRTLSTSVTAVIVPATAKALL